MTVNNFMTFLETYYGEKYTAVTGAVMRDYLSDASETYLDAAVKVTTKRITRSFKVAPGPAELENLHEEILEAMPKRENLPPLPDPNAQYVTAAEVTAILDKFRAKLIAKGKGKAS